MADEPIRDEGVIEIDALPSDDPAKVPPDEGDAGVTFDVGEEGGS